MKKTLLFISNFMKPIRVMTNTYWDNTIRNISDYLIEKENDSDSKARVLHLLYEARELLKERKRQDIRGT